ncbi:MAG: hypothetical protein ACI4F9_07195 [Lachnospiraceae bacterium]
MRKINKKCLGVVCLTAIMMISVMGCDSIKKETAQETTQSSEEVTTEATTEAATESTSISQRSLKAGKYTDVSNSYTITLPEGKWKTIDERLTNTSLSSKKDLIEIENITKESEVKKTLKEIPTLKKSFEKYIEKQKTGLCEDAKLVSSKFTKKSETVGNWYFTFEIEDEVYNYVTFFATYTNDHVVMATGYTEGNSNDRKVLQKCICSIELIDNK